MSFISRDKGVILDRKTALHRLADLVIARRTALRRDRSLAANKAAVPLRVFNLIESKSANKVSPPVMEKVIDSLQLSEEETLLVPVLFGAIYLRSRRGKLARRSHFHRRFVRR
jgi:hypothetical protein